jgi:predicted RNA-binding protein with PIN domain
VPDPTLYLFDGYNLLHAGEFEDVRQLRDVLASFVAFRGARGVLVFDGHGEDEVVGPLEIRYAAHADALLERIAAERRDVDRVCLVSSDSAIRGTSGQDVMKIGSRTFVGDLAPYSHGEPARSEVADRLDPETRARLERLRRAR